MRAMLEIEDLLHQHQFNVKYYNISYTPSKDLFKYIVLTDSHHGFRKLRSCETQLTALLAILNEMAKTFNENEHCIENGYCTS